MMEKIESAIKRVCDWLVKAQKADGRWSGEGKIVDKVPALYQRDIILTSQCLQALVYSQREQYTGNITRALNFCLNYKCEKEGDIDSWAWKLAALRFSDTPISRSIKREIVQHLVEKQGTDGSWPFSISTYSVTNYSVIFAARDQLAQATLARAKKWFINGRDEQGGWKEIPEASASESGFTGGSLISLLMLGEDPTNEFFNKSIDFILSEQTGGKGWAMHRSLKKGISIWATCMCIEALLRVQKNTFDKVVDEGIMQLINRQTPEGYFPRSGGQVAYHTAFYAVRLLALYSYLKDKLASAEAETLRKYIKDQRHLVAYYTEKFEEDALARFKLNVLKSAMTSRALGATSKAIRRRKDILKVLWTNGEREIAEVIDILKRDAYYSYLNKKAYITQIKADMDYLRSLGLVQEQNNRYFAVVEV